MVNDGRYIIVVPPRGKTRHATATTVPIAGVDKIGITLCGRPCGGWYIDGDPSKKIRDCKRCARASESG